MGKKIVISIIGFYEIINGVSFCDLAKVARADGKEPKVVYARETKLDFEGAAIEGEVQNPGEFYFQHRPEEKFDSLLKRRKEFHREMLRDVVLSK